MTTKARIQEILRILRHTYPDAHIILSYRTSWELLVAVILSAQCTDVMVNKVTLRLFKKYPTLDSYADANSAEFEQDIKPTGFYRNKAKHIIAAAKKIRSTFGRSVPNTMEDLLTLPGVARKTANIVLFNAFQKSEGIAVDTHVLRLSKRLQLVSQDAYDNPVKTEEELSMCVPKNEWGEITFWLIDHGRSVCMAKNPLCATCVLCTVCPSASKI